MRARLGVPVTVPILVLTLILAFGGLAHAAGPYPNQLPDFAHPNSPHTLPFPGFPPFSPASGDTNMHPIGSRWLLVIYVRFSDYTNQVPESQITSRFFPAETFGTVSNYFRNASFFKFRLLPAKETGGIPDDGVVTVDLGTFADFSAKSELDQNGSILDAVNPFVDFAHFDSVAGGGNGDGTVSWDELAVFYIATSQPTPTDPQNCGKTRGIPANKELDGKKLVFLMADTRTATNTITMAHELGHQALNVTDLYNVGVSGYALGAATCNADQNVYFYPSAYERVHWGWSQPSIITEDGFYSVFNTAANGPAIFSYILYDPAKGTDDYFIVENRQQRNNSYDWTVPDSGLVIWRVKDSAWPPGSTASRVIDLMRPDGMTVPNQYGGSNVDAWDPGDPNTPQRTMSRTWNDGTPSRVAVRAIRQAEDFTSVNTITAYFDVVGPGILVDPTTPQGVLIRPSVPIGGSVDVSFPVMNTGEATDTFDFTVLVPSGWTATTQQMTLAAGQQATATISVTASASEVVGFKTLAARGRSTTDADISTTVNFFMDVVKRTVSVVYTGDTTAEYSDPATVSARVTDGLNGQPLAGRTVTFELGAQTATADTNANGIATATIVIDQKPTVDLVTATVEPTTTYNGGEDHKSFTIDAEDLTVTITSPLILPLAESTVITVQAVEEDDGSPGDLTLVGVQLNLQPTLTANPHTEQATFDASGAASLTFLDLPSDLWSVDLSLVGEYYETLSLISELVIFDPAAQVSGSIGGTTQSGASIKLSPSTKYSGNTAVGTIQMKSKPNDFKSTEVRWIVISGSRALVEAFGEFNGVPAVQRADIHDSGMPGGKGDIFSVLITSLSGADLYQSDYIDRENGNIHISGSQ